MLPVLLTYHHQATTPIDPHKTDSNEPGLGSVFYSSGWPQSLAWAASQWPSPAPAKLAIQLGENMLEKFGSPTKIFKIWAIMGIEPKYSHIRTKFYGNRTNKKYVSPTKTGLQHPPTIEFLGYSAPSGWLWLTACYGKWPLFCWEKCINMMIYLWRCSIATLNIQKLILGWIMFIDRYDKHSRGKYPINGPFF